MPKQINTPLPGQSLVRKFSLKGRYQPVLDETIVPVTVVEQDAPQTKRIASWGVAALAAGAGNSTSFWLTNLANSGHLIVVTKFWAHSGSPLTDHYDATIIAAVGGFSGPQFRDGRLVARNEKPIAEVTSGGGATAVIGFPRYEADATQYDVEYVIEPGQSLRMKQGLSNQTFDMFWIWYEVSLAGGEVQF